MEWLPGQITRMLQKSDFLSPTKFGRVCLNIEVNHTGLYLLTHHLATLS